MMEEVNVDLSRPLAQTDGMRQVTEDNIGVALKRSRPKIGNVQAACSSGILAESRTWALSVSRLRVSRYENWVYSTGDGWGCGEMRIYRVVYVHHGFTN